MIDPDGLEGVEIQKPTTDGGKKTLHVHYGTESNPRRDGAVWRDGSTVHEGDKAPNARQKKLIKKLYPVFFLRGSAPFFLLPGQIECLNNPIKCSPNYCGEDQA